MEEWLDYPAEWVLDHGLPRLPGSRLPDFAEAPIAMWTGGHYGAVLFVNSDPNDLYPFYWTIEVMQRRAGHWDALGDRSGGPWWANIDQLPPGRRVEWIDGAQRLVSDRETLWVVGGIAGPGVDSIGVGQGEDAWSFAIDTPSRVFLIGLITPPAVDLAPVDGDRSASTEASQRRRLGPGR